MRVQAHPQLSSERFVLEAFEVGRTFVEVDLGDASILEVLRAYVGSHVRLHPDDLGELVPHGLALDPGGRLVNFESAVAAEAAVEHAIADVEDADARRRERKHGPATTPESDTGPDPSVVTDGDPETVTRKPRKVRR